MKSFGDLQNLFVSLSLNSTATNKALGGILLNDQHRYLLLRFFDNERSFTMTTVGPQTLATTGTLPTTSTNATLTSAWPYITCQQMVVFNGGDQRTVNFTQNSTAITWQSGLTTATSTGSIATVGVQFYPLPANVSKIKNSTITIGQLVYTPAPVQSIQEWTKLNALPYTSSIPAYFFIYNNQIGFWPIPAATGEIVTLNCQIFVPDMTYQNYSTGSIGTLTAGSNVVIGTSTSWNTNFPQNTDLTFTNLYMTINPPNGDGLYYPIQYFSNGTNATLTKPIVNAPIATGANYTIGQYPLLHPDFHDAIVYGALRIYFASIAKDTEKYTLYDTLLKEKLEQMKFYLSNKQVNVDLSVTPVQTNPNLYTFGVNP